MSQRMKQKEDCCSLGLVWNFLILDCQVIHLLGYSWFELRLILGGPSWFTNTFAQRMEQKLRNRSS